jgi:TPR repeat protein
MDGDGIDKNHDKAFKLSKKLADENYSSGINLLGYCYDLGVGTNVDNQKAFKSYRKAADLGNSHGINNLGRCYCHGIGTDVNMEKAFKLYQKAAKLGDNVAQSELAFIYENGEEIVLRDIDQAIYWYKISAEQEIQNAHESESLLDIKEWFM